MNKWQIVGIVGAVIAIIGMFLPWATVSATDVEPVTVYGYIAPLLWVFVVLTLVGAAIPKPSGGILAFVFGLLGFLYAIWTQMGIYAIKTTYESAGYGDVQLTIGYGGYVIILGFLIAFIGGILQYVSLKKERKAAVQQTAAPAQAEQTPEARTEESPTEEKSAGQ